MENQITTKNFYDVMIRLAFLTLIVAWCLMILLPFVSIILWSIILAMALKPMHDSLSKLMGGRLKLASAIIILGFVMIILIPGWLFFDSIIEGVKNLKASFDAGTLTIPPPTEEVKTWPVIGNKLYEAWLAASQNLMAFLMQYKEQLVGVGTKLLKGLLSVGSGSIQLIASFIIAGFLLVIPGIGESMRKFFRKVVGEKGDEFFEMTYKTVGNVVKGILGVAFIQAILIGVGFLLAGVPFAGLWTLIVFIFAVLQIPPAIIVYPIIVYLFSYLSVGTAIFWTVYLLIAGLSDNILKPILLGKGAPVPMLVIFMGVIGGFIFSGFIGLFTGAIVISIGYKLLIAWINDFEPKPVEKEVSA